MRARDAADAFPDLIARARLWPIAAAGLLLGLSVYAYKSALLLAPTYLGLTLAVVAWRAHTLGLPVRRIWTMAAVAVVALFAFGGVLADAVAFPAGGAAAIAERTSRARCRKTP